MQLLAKRDLLDLCLEGLAAHLAARSLHHEASLLQVWTPSSASTAFTLLQQINICVRSTALCLVSRPEALVRLGKAAA